MDSTKHRPRLVPATAIIAAVVIIVLVAAAIGAEVWFYRSSLVSVPDVAGMSIGAATSAVEASRLGVMVAGVRVSGDVPADAVLSQSPEPGTRLPRGSVVELVLSAGPQAVRLPDVVGLPVEEARDTLERLGLDVREVSSSSESTQTTVLEMYPAPGSVLSTGDTVRLTVPGLPAASDVLLPFDLAGIGVLIDPVKASGALETDPALQIARRLLSLLQASGAEVTLVRGSATAGVSAAERERMSRESTAAVYVAIDAGGSDPGSITVSYPGTPGSTTTSSSSALARAITGALQLPGANVNAPATSSDVVSTAFPGAAARVSLGDSGDAVDVARFRDPEWVDAVARSLYRGVGQVLTGASAPDGVN